MNPPFRILLTNSTGLYAGGEYYVLELAKELRRRGHSIWVSAKPDNLLTEKCRQAGVAVLPLDYPSNGRLVHFIKELKRFINDHQIQLVHTNSNYDRTAGAIAARLSGVPHVTNVHSFHSIQHNLTHWWRNRYVTDHFIVDGICVRDLLIQKDRLAPSNISVIHLGVDPTTMRGDEVLRRRVRAEFRLTDETVVVGNVGRLVPFKGQEYLIRAFASVSQDVQDVHLMIVGDGELKSSLHRCATELGVGDRVTFTGFRDDLPAIYSAFDVYAHSSIEGGGETFPFAVLQALAQELPAVVTRVGDVPAMVIDGVNGLVVPDRDAEAFARALRPLLTAPVQRATMSEAGHKLFLERFTIHRMVDDVEHVYAALLDV